MGLRDFFTGMFRKQKPKQLPSPEREEKMRKTLNRLSVYAEQEDGKTVNVIKIKVGGHLIPIAELTEETTGSLRDIADEITDALDSIEKYTSSLAKPEEKKRKAIEKLDFIAQFHNLRYIADVKEIVDVYVPQERLDYRRLDKTIPRTIDIGAMTGGQIQGIGQSLNRRMKVLSNIKTPEQAYSDREGLVDFMKSQEVEDPLGLIVAANIQTMSDPRRYNLDLDTIIACAEQVSELNNEDNLLYSSYLKLEENRILRRIQKQLLAYKKEHDEDEKVDELIEYMDEAQLQADEDSNLTSIFEYMIDIRAQQSIPEYAKKHVKKDIRLKKFVVEKELPEAEQILQYLNARMASFGQVTKPTKEEKRNARIPSLREFIETTEYKEPEDRQTKSFLMMVANLEKDFIQRNYALILERYQEMTKGQDREEEQEVK